MSTEKVSFVIKRSQRSKLAQYWSTLGFIFEIIRAIDPKLKYMMDAFTVIGIIWSSKFFFKLSINFVRGFYVFVWSRFWSLDLKKKYGEWVLITGATDGIGLEYARQFGKRGHSLMVLGRNPEKLERVKNELLTENPSIEVVTILADLNKTDPSMYKDIFNQIEPYKDKIGILINNAGIMHESPNCYMDQDEDNIMQQVRVNMVALLMMTRIVLPFMLSRHKGLIINISSIAGLKPLPLMGLYSANKKFVEQFSQTLQYEYKKSHNIDIQILVPSYIKTKMIKWSNFLSAGGYFTPNTKTFVSSAIATIGRTNHTTGYWSHGLQYLFYDKMIPQWLYSLMSWHFFKSINTSCFKKKSL